MPALLRRPIPVLLCRDPPLLIPSAPFIMALELHVSAQLCHYLILGSFLFCFFPSCRVDLYDQVIAIEQHF